MVFNDTTTKLGICQEIDSLCDSDTTSYPVADKVRRVNQAMEQVIGWILNADGTWQWDDTNYTDTPRGTINLVDNQSSYTFNDRLLQVEKVAVKNSDGDWYELSPIDPSEYDGILEQDFETKGLPEYYDKISDDTINIYPAPSSTSVTTTAGLKVWYSRTSHPFVAGDTSAEPGFASPYHIILCYMASIPYCMTYKKDRVGLYEQKVAQLKDDLIKHYSQRERDKRKQMTLKNRVFK